MRRRTRAGVGTTIVAASLLAWVTPASAQGTTVGGAGAGYYLNDAFSGRANIQLAYGERSDEVYAGDWDGNGTDTLMVRRGNVFYIRNSTTSGPADGVFAYGDPGDTVLVGDWDGNGSDTLAVRRGGTYFIKNSVNTGTADTVFSYGDPGDPVLVGNWDGQDGDTLMVRRGGHYFVKNDLSTGVASSDFFYGDPGDEILTGRWSSGQVGDTLGVRRGGTYYLRHSLTSGPADRVLAYGDPTDTAFSGDWNGDGVDTLGVRRVSTPVRNSGFGNSTYVVGRDIAPGTYRTGGTPKSCYWEILSGFGDTLDEVTASGFGGPEIVTIEATDAGFMSEGCEPWQPLEATYPPAPLTVFDGEGTFEVGTQIAPGTYRPSTPDGTCYYWERLSDFRHNWFTSRIDNSDTTELDRFVVTIEASDVGFSSVSCGTWTRVP